MGKMSQIDSISLSQYRITENFKDGKIIEGFIADKCYHFLVQKLSPRGSGKAT
jgi:hypothetical protein